MANSEEGMVQEAMAAVHAGERARARDLFTRLLKINPEQPDYWLWMSAVVETKRERTYCLQEVLKRDPKNAAARRGMQILGIATPDEAAVVPLKAQRRNWQAAFQEGDQAEKQMAARNLRVTLGVAGGLALVVLAAVAGILSTRRPKYIVVQVTPDLSYRASPTFLPTSSPVVRSATPTFSGPTPLWMRLEVTYTPTPLYVSTPHSPEAYRIALRAYERGDWAGVEEYLSQVSTLQPNQPDLLYYAGEANRFRGQYAAAARYYNQAISAAPAFAPAYLGRARAFLAEDPTAREAPLEDLTRALELDPNLIEAYLEMAALKLADRQYAETLSLVENAAQLQPDSAPAAYLRAAALLRLERLEEGLAAARRANSLDLTYLPAYRLLGEALLANGLGDEALEPLRTFTAYEQQDPGAYALLGDACAAAGDPAAALETYGRALALDGRSFTVLMRRGDLYYRQGDFEEAAADFGAAEKLDKTQYSVALSLGQANFQLEIFGGAYLSFERAFGLAENPRQKAEAMFWRAQSLEKLAEPVAALRDYKALLELPQGDADPEWLSLARERAAVLATPTKTPPLPTQTLTPRPSATLRPSAPPSRTPTPKP